ncbi:uncharacterized protein HaLaN_21569, partial [Haematococcus lacustris]
MGRDEARIPLLHDVEAGAVLKSGTSWVLTATVLLGDMFGLGQLTLPQTFARLGYAPASALLLVFCVLCCYSGFLYQRLAILCPEASLFDQVARRAMGRTGVALVWGSMYLAIFLCPLIFQITCAEALKQVLYQYEVSTLAANLAVALMIIPLAQVTAGCRVRQGRRASKGSHSKGRCTT